MAKFCIGSDEFDEGDPVLVKWTTMLNPFTRGGYRILSDHTPGENITLRYVGYVDYYHRDTGEVDEDGDPIYEKTDEIVEVCLAFEYTWKNGERYAQTMWLTPAEIIGTPVKDKRWVSRRLVKMMEESR